MSDDPTAPESSPQPVTQQPGRPRCTALGCAKPVRARGLCRGHYQAVRRAEAKERDALQAQPATWPTAPARARIRPEDLTREEVVACILYAREVVERTEPFRHLFANPARPPGT